MPDYSAIIKVSIPNRYAKIWEKTYGGIYEDVANSIQQTSDGGYIVAGYSGYYYYYYFYILKLNNYGNIVWGKSYGKYDYDNIAYSIQQASDGGYIAVGYTTGYGSGARDIYVIKIDDEGNAKALNVGITEPVKNAQVSGIITIKTNVVSSNSVSKVEFYLDDVIKIGDCATQPYYLNFDTREVKNGEHKLTVKVFDSSGKFDTSSIKIFVNN